MSVKYYNRTYRIEYEVVDFLKDCGWDFSEISVYSNYAIKNNTNPPLLKVFMDKIFYLVKIGILEAHTTPTPTIKLNYFLAQKYRDELPF